MATDLISRLRRPLDPLAGLTTDGQLSREDNYRTAQAGDSQFTKGLRSGVAGISAGSFADDALDMEAAGDAGWQAARDNALAVQQQGELYAPRVRSLRDIRSVGDAGDFAAGAFGQGLASMAPTLAAAALTRGRGRLGTAQAFGGGMAAGYQMERGEQALSQYTDPVQMLASAEERDAIARNKGLVGGALEALVPATLGRVGLRGAPSSYLGKVGTGSLTEGLTESAQTGAGFVADRALNQQRELDPWEVADAFAMGALTGGGVSAAGNLRDLAPERPVRDDGVPLDGADVAPAPAPTPRGPQSERIRPEDIPANDLGVADAQPEVAPRTDGVALDAEPGAAREPGDESPYDRLLRTVNERFGDSVRAGVDKAAEAAGKAKNKVDGIVDRMATAVEESKTPDEFFRSVFGSPEEDAEPLVLGDEDPKLGGATIEDTQANMARRREENLQRSQAYAETLMNDERVPKMVRDRVARFNGDYSSPDVQRFIGAQYKMRAVNAKVSDTADKLLDIAKQGVAAAGKRIRRNNLMSGTPEERAQYTRLVFDGLTDEAKADSALMDRLPEIASAMVALSSRVGDLDSSDLANLSDVQDALSLFKDPEMLAAQVAEVAGITEPGTFVSKIMKISGARQDVKQSNSFLYSMLSEDAKDSMTTKQLSELASFVDSFGLRSDKGQDKALKALGTVFGSPERARMVMDYYRDQNRAAAELDDGPLADDEDTAEVDATDSAESGFVDRDAGAQGINEGQAPQATYVFKDAKSGRPFRVDQRSQSAAAGREMNARRELGANTNRTPIPYSQYVEELGRDAGMELGRIVSDINKRLGEALRGLASEYGIAKPKSDDAQREAFNRAMAGEASPNPKSTRIENIKELYGELALLTKVQEEGGDKAALDLYEVLKVEGNESLDLVASDEDIAAMGVDKSGRNSKTTTVTFTKADGSKLALNAESIWQRMHAKEGPGGGENRIARIRRLFAEGVAAVLNREDIAGVEGGLADAVLRNKPSEKPLTATKQIDAEKVREKLAILKNFQGELSALKKKLKEMTDLYADNIGGETGEKIRAAMERNLGNYQRDLDEAKSQEQAYFAAKDQGKHLKPSSGLAFNKPAQAVTRRKIELYRDALQRMSDDDFSAAMEERDNNRPGMPGSDETGPYGKAGLNRTAMNEQTTGEARRYEEDTGLGVGVETRGSNASAPMDEGEGKTKTAKFKLADSRKPAAAFGGRKVLAEQPTNTAKVKELEAKMASIRQRVANSPDMSEQQKQELRDHYADLQAELNAAKRDTTTAKAEVPAGDRIVSPRGARQKRDSRLNSIVPKDDRVQSAAEAAVQYLELLDKQGRAIPNHKRVVGVLKKIAGMGDFMAELVGDGSIFDFDKMNASHVPGLLRMMQKRAQNQPVEQEQEPAPVEAPSAETIQRVFNISAQDNWQRLKTPEDVVSFAEEARATYDFLKSKPELERTDREDSLLWSLESQFESNGYAAFDWASLFDGMEPTKEHYEAVLKAVAGKQSAMRPKRGRPAKVDQQVLADIKAEILKTRGKDVQVVMSRVHSALGGSGEWSMSPDKTNRIIEIAVNAANPMSVARHEALHDFFGMLGEDAAGRSIKRDLKDAAEAPHVKRQLRKLLEKHPEALKQIEEDAEERVAYMYQFWAEGVLRVGPRGTGIFQRLREMFRDLLGIVGSTQRAEDLMTALQDGKFAEPSLVAEVLEDMGSSRVHDKIRRLSPQLDKTLKAVAQAAPDRLRSYQNDNIAKIADLFSSEKGTLGFIQKRYQTEGKWENKLAGILAGTTAVERSRALRNLQAMKDPSSKLEQDLAGFLSEIHDYMSKSGVKTRDSQSGKWVPIRKVGNYFPRVFDRSAILANESEWRQLLKDNGVSAEQINKITKAITHGDGQLDLAENPQSLGYTPYAEAVQDRKLTFITKANAEKFVKFQKHDLADILLGYSKQAAHRAEYAGTFGNNGEIIQQLVEESGIKDEREIKDIMTVVQALEGTSGYGMSSATKEVMASVMTMQNLVLLPLSLFSQMVDPIYLAARTGDIKDAGRAYLAGLQRLKNHVAKNGKKIDGEELAEMMGIISQDSVLEAMGVAYGSSYMSSGTRNVNRVFFKYTGMQGWNSSMRIVATRAGERYLIENKDNAEALKELGLTPKDIKFSSMVPGGNGRVQTRLDMSSPQMQQAMFRFVDQAVIRPSASQRPAWMSDPRFLLVAHLKQFIFAMHNVVLKRASQQLTEGNSKPWLTLMLAMPVILAADLTKFALTGSAPTNWGITDYIGHAVTRSGLLGYGDFGNQVLNDAERGRLPGESLLGPAFEHAATVMRWVAGDAGTSVDDVIARSVPGARFVD